MLYSLGRAAQAAGDAGAAAALYQRYLDGGRDEIPEERRREVEEVIEGVEQRLDGGKP